MEIKTIELPNIISDKIEIKRVYQSIFNPK